MARPDDVVEDPRTLLDARISEKDFMGQVIVLAKARGWFVYHTYDSRRSEYGFPDLVMVRAPRLIFAELKREHGHLTDEQAMWLNQLRSAYQEEVYVWYPSEWESIEAILA